MAPRQTWHLIAAFMPLKMQKEKKRKKNRKYSGMTSAKFVKSTREFSNSFAYKQGSPEQFCVFYHKDILLFCFIHFEG